VLDADLVLVDELLQLIPDEVLLEDGLLLYVVTDDGYILHEGLGQFLEHLEGKR
jgi:hypothetical protein